MKKISLKDVKNGLKRDEMRVISGGSDTGGGGSDCWLLVGDPLCCACKKHYYAWYCSMVYGCS